MVTRPKPGVMDCLHFKQKQEVGHVDVQIICHVDDMDMDTIRLGFSCFILEGMESHNFIVLFSVMTSL